jgi:hypothetical protein
VDDSAKRLIYERNGVSAPRFTNRTGFSGSFSDPEALRIVAARNGGRLGSVVNTPGQILNAMNVVDRLVDSLGVAVNAQAAKLPKNTVKQFADFWNEWKKFYQDNSGLWSRFWEGTYEQTLAYQARAVEWQKRLGKAGADVTPDAPSSDKPAASPTQVLMYVGLGVAVLVGLVLVTRLVSPAVALAEAEDAAVAIAEAKRRKLRVRRVLSIS